MSNTSQAPSVEDLREERRVITALFADLVGSTPLGEQLDAEEVKLVVGEAISRIVLEVERLGGHVKDLAGDGVLAFFGAPMAFEDDAERAALTSLRIVDETAAYGAEVERSWASPGSASGSGSRRGPSSSARSAPEPGSSTPPSATPSTRLPGCRRRPSRGRCWSTPPRGACSSRSSSGTSRSSSS